MRIQRSWGLSVLAIIAVMIGVHDSSAQSYPQPGPAPANAGYPGMPAQVPPGMAAPTGAGLAPQYAPAPGAMPGMPPGYPQMAQLPPGYPQMAQLPPQAGPMMPPGAMGGPMMPPGAMAGSMMPPGGRPSPMMPQGGMMRDMRVPAGPMGPMGPPGGAMGGGAMRPAAYYNPSQGSAPQQLSPTPAMPMGGEGMPAYPTMADGETCGYCGGHGCEVCACNDFDLKILDWLLPYGAGGCGAPRWYDASVQWISFKRDSIGDSLVFATDGISGVPVLSTDQLDFADESGVRISFAMQLGAGNSLETTYMGGLNWSSQAQATSDVNELYSIYSDYGNTPPPWGFVETDRTSLQSLVYTSKLDTIELNYRQRWVSPNVRIQGSWLAGARYTALNEKFHYATVSTLNNASSDTLVQTLNSVTGGQIGGDLWVCIMPGLSIGGEAKVGVFGNHASQHTSIQTTSVADPYLENAAANSVAFMGDANLTLLWRITQNWTFRGGYSFLVLTDVALASDNFNPAVAIVGPANPRPALIDSDSSVTYHGLNLGFEYMW